MLDKTAFDRLAERELARHRPDLKYADIQLCKRGDFEVVARAIRRRKYVALYTYGGGVVVMSVLACLFGPRNLIFHVLIWSFLAIRMFEEYIHARRTEEIIQRLREERDRLNGDVREGAA